jgi:multiple sugar transport system substrate-binding protein
LDRRTFVRTAGATALGTTVAASAARAQSSRYAKYQGKTVTVSIPAHPHYDAMVKLIPAFTRETGIKVELDKLQILRMKDKQLLEMAKPQGDYDLISYVVMWKGEYVSKGLIQPLDPFLRNAALADPDFDMKDIVPGYLENIGLVGGPKGYLAGPGATLYGLPYGAETSILAYRRDLFDKHQLKPPTTYTELEAMLPIVREKTGIGALTSRGQSGHQCVHAWLLHLNPLGGRVFDDNWKPQFNDETGVRALKLLKLIAETGPAGIPGYGQGEMMTAFLQGQSAMYLDATVIFGPVRDTTRSRIAGNVGYALHPKGSRFSSQTGGLGLAIPKNARNAEAAFLLMQWLTSKTQDRAVVVAGGAPSRVSTINADILKAFPEYLILREQLKHANPDWRPIIPVWDEINVQALGVAISQALTGSKAPEQALDEVVPKVLEILRRGGYKV